MCYSLKSDIYFIISRLGLEPTKMADKNCVEDILGSMLPKQSQKVYEHTWKEFSEFAGHDNPAEGDFIQYFHFLRETKSMKASTIWSTYSRLNSVCQTKTGKRLQQWPRITQLLKSYNKSYEIYLHMYDPLWHIRSLKLNKITYSTINSMEVHFILPLMFVLHSLAGARS